MDKDAQVSIGELAREAGVTVRTVHYYVAEGLLPPPHVQGRHSRYGYGHLLRLRLIKALQANDKPLRKIRAQLAEMSEGQMESLLSTIQQQAEGGEEVEPRALLAALLGRPLNHQHAALLLDWVGERDGSLASGRWMSLEPPDQRGLVQETLWRRIVLAPGVELHVQPSAFSVPEKALEKLSAVIRATLAKYRRG